LGPEHLNRSGDELNR